MERAQSQRWYKVVFSLILLGIKGKWRKLTRYMPTRIVKRRKKLIEEINAIFPDQHPVNVSREALIGNTSSIAAQIEWADLSLNLILYIAGLFTVVLCILVNGGASHAFNVSNPLASLPYIVSVLVLLLELFLLIILGIFVIWAQKWKLISNAFLMVLVLALPVGGFIPEALVSGGGWRMPEAWLARSAIQGSFVFSLCSSVIITSGVVALVLDTLITSRYRLRYPRAFLLRELFNALSEVIALKKEDRLANPGTRQFLVTKLEDAAKCIEVIPNGVSGRDRFSITWNQQEYLRRASGVRDLKKWVLLPKVETRDNLEQELRRVLHLAAVGDWDGLPQADSNGDPSIPWWRRALMLIRSIIIAVLPAVAVIVFGDKLSEGDFKNYLKGLAGIWALISLLTILDPRFGEKLSAFKDLPSFLPFGGRRRE